MEVNNFDKMNLKENLVRGIYAYGFEYPSIIQQRAIPLILQGKDVIAQSQSGTGKTGAFTISAIQIVDEKMQGCQVLIIAHTRELAQQIYDVGKSLSHYTSVKFILCMGGQNIKETEDELRSGSIIAVCTPGRLLDLIKRKFISVRLVKLLIVDEADEMLSYSFQDQLRSIIKQLSPATQISLFSATMPDHMFKITDKFLRHPEQILIEKDKLTLEGINQFYIKTDNELWKFETLCDLYDMISVSQTIIYINSIKKGEELKEQLEKKNFTVSLIHSGMGITQRNDIMKNFRRGNTRMLISTDLLSRGIDIQQISVVINYDIPRNKESYLHRIGRSGRFGRKGVAINLVTRYDDRIFRDIQDYYKININPMPETIQNYL